MRGVRSGLPVAEALQAAGQELPNQVGALFREVTGNVKLGKTLDESLAMAARTLDVQEFKFFMISLTIQQETGGNLGEILYNLGMLMRRREQMKLKIKAMSSEARASAMIIGSLPFVMFCVIYLIDPELHHEAVHRPARLDAAGGRNDQPWARAWDHEQDDPVRDMSAVDAYLPLGLTVASLLAYAVGAVTFASVSWASGVRCSSSGRRPRGSAR